ncbi:calcineurin-like phosphoesterase-domain-containing protein [Chaetomium strumarium]|uniref:Calcineurin-like phosphoesterase-domain-containing protein n=1 Tax=Chaetomium strumarium TaxID=1170767 RepID=A0AAJ0M6F6_9PEZI|nr:calcineurin-like phosphoesterase-domain-containing protein [Chaetomium strumarium]
MARPYSSKSDFAYPPRYYPDHSTSLLDDFRALVAQAFRSLVRFWRERGHGVVFAAMWTAVYRLRQNMAYHRLLSFPHLLVAVWVVVLLWGERWVFHSKVESCDWSYWEKWPAGAEPHRVALVADPQLIDAHSYPGRPWPLNSLTVRITDNYLRRSYNQLQWRLDPDSIFFLGDLFDGGREWKTAHGSFEDPAWGPHPKHEQKYLKKWHKKYGESYWLEEYARFGGIFVDPWVKAGAEQEAGRRRRKLVASLPGNHDLGFGDQIKVSVRNRFETYFGEGNRVDVIGNHTFVSVDTVSMSAASSAEASRHDLRPIYEPVERFLNDVKQTKQKAVDRELRLLRGEGQESELPHKVEEAGKVRKTDDKSSRGGNAPELPTILLTHVPLHRPPGTPCGPLRERWPPTKPPKGQTDPVLPDHRNAISVSGGYQYQNVLGEKDSEELIQKVGNVVHAFSGDDHDYCEVTHSAAQANVREITVKSISMAMGVSKPGFLLMSLYNPIDPATGQPLTSGEHQPTLQTHLCLLPSQVSTYLRYVSFALVCVIVLAVRACLVPILGLKPFALDLAESYPSGPEQQRRNGSILPQFKAKVEDYEEYTLPRGFSASHRLSNGNSTTRDRSGSASSYNMPLGARPNGIATAQARNPSPNPKGGGGGLHRSGSSGGGHHGRRKSHGNGSKYGGGGRWGVGRAAPRIEIPSENEEEEMMYGGYNGKWKAAAWKRRGLASRQPRSTVGVVVTELWTTVWRVAWMVVGFFAWLTWKG